MKKLRKHPLDTSRMSVGSKSLVNWMRLNAAIQQPGKILCKSGFANPQHIFNHEMAVGEKANNAQFNSLGVTLNDSADVLLECLEC